MASHLVLTSIVKLGLAFEGVPDGKGVVLDKLLANVADEAGCLALVEGGLGMVFFSGDRGGGLRARGLVFHWGEAMVQN